MFLKRIRLIPALLAEVSSQDLLPTWSLLGNLGVKPSKEDCDLHTGTCQTEVGSDVLLYLFQDHCFLGQLKKADK